MKENIKMEKDMEKEKNIIEAEFYLMKENIRMSFFMEKEKDII